MKNLKEKRFKEKQEGIEHTEQIEDIKGEREEKNEQWIKNSVKEYDAKQSA
jgi:hypothetical protein